MAYDAAKTDILKKLAKAKAAAAPKEMPKHWLP
jgi:hypothetical protein